MASLAIVFVLTTMLGAVLFVEMATPIRREGTRISDGHLAEPNQFPYMAYIESEGHADYSTRHCSGSLITRHAILTTAWCIQHHNKHTVRMGTIYRTGDDHNALTFVSTWSLMYPEYDGETCAHNVGLIFLPGKVFLGENIRPVKLPSSRQVGSFVGYEGFVIGWGRTSPGSALSEELRWAKVTVLPNDICEELHNMTDHRVCAGGQHVLYGDDGAPLVVHTGERYLQIGIHSRRDSPYNITKPAVYERVSSYIEWIKEKTVHQ